MGKAAIIIVNYKDYAEKYLKDCVESLREQSRQNFRLFIIDNASSEESLGYLKKNAPEAEVLRRNDGNYSAANKLGIETALKRGYEYFVIANMDVVFDKNWLKELIESFGRDSRAGIVQSKVMLFSDKDKINSVGNIIHFLGFGFTKGYNEKDAGQYDDIDEIKGYPSGSSMAIKKEVIEKIGSYDSAYYMYHDDLEMGWRARLAGYKIILAKDSVVYHKYKFSRSVKMIYYMERNRYLAVFSFYKLLTILLILPALLVMDLGMLLYSMVNGWFLAKLKVYFYFINPYNWMLIIKARRKVKKYRKIKDRDIVQDIAGKVEYQEIMNPVLKHFVNPVLNIYWSAVKKIIVW